MFNSLSDFIELLEKENELIHIYEFADPVLEIPEIVDRVCKSEDGGKSLLFHNNGTKFPLLINAYGSRKRISAALYTKDIDQIEKRINALIGKIKPTGTSFVDKLRLLSDLKKIGDWLPKEKKISHPRCQQNIMLKPDLTQLPVLKCWPEDGGRFITLPIVITKDPETKIRNTGMYRMQVFDKNLTAMHWHKHKNAARHYQLYARKKQKMPVAVVLGGDPVYTFCATAPLPDNMDEFLLAGFLRNKGVSFVKCLTQDIEVPVDADIVIEGYIDPEEELIWEGPFGDHTGFYSLPDWYPKFHITCISYANSAIYPATIVGVPPQEDAWLGKATESIFKTPIKLSILPELNDLNLPILGVAHNLAIVSINKQFAGHSHKVKSALWGAGQMMFNKVLAVFNQDVDIHNLTEVVMIICKNVDPAKDIDFGKGPLDILDHSSMNQGFGGKMMIDATNERKMIDPVLKQTDIDELIQSCAGISGINKSLIKKELPILIISVDSYSENTQKELVDFFNNNIRFVGLKFVILVEHFVNVDDYNLLSWYALNNIDPERDCYIIQRKIGAILMVNACRKRKQKGQFERDWPNVVVMNNDTIKLVDEKWAKYNIGTFIASPSEKIKYLNENEGPVADMS